jgi:hypothetical protein
MNNFLEIWNTLMLFGGIAIIVAGLVYYLLYFFRLSIIPDFKSKYDFINTSEIGWFKRVFLIVGIGVAFLINTYASDTIKEMGAWFFVRFFFGIAGATLIAYIAALVLDYWYPTKINSKLRKWRYMPRINPKTGDKMKLLSEDEEDVHLDAGMIAEENVFSIDYDVWIDEKTKEVKIEKYPGHLTALRCNNCGFYTMRVVKEEIVEKYEDGSPKELLKNYQCSYCKNKRATQFNISTKEADDYKNIKPKSTKSPRNVELVKIEIRAGHKGNKFYEFQSIEEAQAFLEAFDFDKLA